MKRELKDCSVSQIHRDVFDYRTIPYEEGTESPLLQFGRL